MIVRHEWYKCQLSIVKKRSIICMLYKIVNLQERKICRMKENSLKQEELLQILMHAYQKGEHSNEITTKEMLDELILQFRKVYAS